MFSPASAWAESPKSPPSEQPGDAAALAETLRACDLSLVATKRVADTQGELLLAQDTMLRNQARELTEQRGKLLDNPLLWFAAGMLVTGLTVHFVR